MSETIATITITLDADDYISVNGRATGCRFEDRELASIAPRAYGWRCDCDNSSESLVDDRLALLDAARHARDVHGAW